MHTLALPVLPRLGDLFACLPPWMALRIDVQRPDESVESELDTLYRRLEAIARHRDGREFPIEVALAASGAEHNRMITAYLRDISDRKHSEALMREAKEKIGRAHV